MVSTAYREQCRVMVAEARQVEGEDTHQMVIAAGERSRNGDDDRRQLLLPVCVYYSCRLTSC